MTAEVFVDSNVLLYMVSRDIQKSLRAQALIRDQPLISTQVLGEFVNVARRKFKMTWNEVRIALAPIRSACAVVSVTVATHDLGLDLAEKTNLRMYDAQIVAAASLAGCHTLFTEDLNHGQRIAGVMIRNPFV